MLSIVGKKFQTGLEKRKREAASSLIFRGGSAGDEHTGGDPAAHDHPENTVHFAVGCPGRNRICPERVDA